MQEFVARSIVANNNEAWGRFGVPKIFCVFFFVGVQHTTNGRGDNWVTPKVIYQMPPNRVHVHGDVAAMTVE